jgi:hypothetical protein
MPYTRYGVKGRDAGQYFVLSTLSSPLEEGWRSIVPFQFPRSGVETIISCFAVFLSKVFLNW